MSKRPLTAERLRQCLRYDPETGVFTRLINRPNAPIGSVAGCLDLSTGYLRISVDGGQYWAQRLAWLYMTGEWPRYHIDHRDMIGSNNRWNNLREATKSQNMCNTRARKNSKSGAKGIIWDATRQKWRAEIAIGRKRYYVGRFDDFEEAKSAYEDANKKLHGDFARVA